MGIPKESFLNERRVGVVPATVKNLTKKGFTVNYEESAGLLAKFTNDDYAAAGANVKTAKEAWESDLVLKVSTGNALNHVNIYQCPVPVTVV